jgi:hypothetical protein
VPRHVIAGLVPVGDAAIGAGSVYQLSALVRPHLTFARRLGRVSAAGCANHDREQPG